MNDVRDIVYNLLDPIGYGYELSDCKLIIEIILKRIYQEDLDKEYNEIIFRLASLIFQQLVFFFGNYGLAPWFGWIDQEYKDEVINRIKEWIKFEEVSEELNK